MNDFSYKNWHSMSDNALTEHIGAFIKHHRLNQNKTQDEVANEAGISRSTLSLLEKGETVNLSSLIQVMRVLNLLHIMDAFQIEPTISPIALAEMEQKKRIRARSSKDDKPEASDW